MRKTSKAILVRGTSYRVTVAPMGGAYARVYVSSGGPGTCVGTVKQHEDKSGWLFEDRTGRRYSRTLLREVLHEEAWAVDEARRFTAEVDSYDGPMDVSDATTPCTDCGQDVLVRTPDLPAGEGGECPKATGHYTGHRVSSEAYYAWQRQQAVIAAVTARQNQEPTNA